MALAKRACELTEYKQPAALDTLAVAYAEAGRFQDAVDMAEKALELAIGLGQEELAREIRAHLEMFREGKAVRE